MSVLIKNLKNVFSGEGFIKKKGRHAECGDCGHIKGPVNIFIDNGKISYIGLDAPKSNETIDATGLSATSGFVDSHTHSLHVGNRFHEQFQKWNGKNYSEIAAQGGGIKSTFRSIEKASDSELESALTKNINKIIASGSTCIEVKSGYGKNSEQELRMLETIRSFANKHLNIDIISTFLGLHAIPEGKTPNDHVEEMMELLNIVKSRNLAQYVDAFPEDGFFAVAETLRFFRKAKELGFKAKVHADQITDKKSTEQFTLFGALSVDHLESADKNSFSLLAQKDTIATLLPAASFYLQMQYADARSLIDSGARVALATDFNPGSAPCYRMGYTCLLAASKMHMTTAEILCAATYNGAAALELDNRKGALVSGFDADICLWDLQSDTPLDELVVKNENPEIVFLKGKKF